MTFSQYMMYWFKPHRLENLNYTFLEHVWLMTAMGTVGLMIIMLILEIPPLKRMIRRFREYVHTDRQRRLEPPHYETFVRDRYCVDIKELMIENSQSVWK